MNSKEYKEGYSKACEHVVRMIEENHSNVAIKILCEQSVERIKEDLGGEEIFEEDAPRPMEYQ